MDLLQILGVSSSFLLFFIAIVFGVIVLCVFFSDPLRKWRFFGYLPTVVVALIDPIRKKILTVRYDTNYYGHKIPIQLPQGGIYSNNIGNAVRSILERTMGIAPYLYDIKHVRILGALNVQKHHERMQKYQFGVFGISPLILGKGYVGCLCICDSRVVMKSRIKGIGIEELSFVDNEEFKKNQKLCDDTYDGKRILYNKLMVVVDNYLHGKG